MGSIITAAELLRMELKEVPSLVKGVFPKKGLVALGGSSDTGKSTLARQLAMSIVSGEKEFLGFELNSLHKRVLYVSTEDDDFATSVVLKNQQSFFECSDESFEYLSFIFETNDLLHRIETELEKAPHDLIIIDAFADVFGGDMNQANQVRNYLDDFSQLSQKHSCLVLIVHHSGKGAEYKIPSKNNLLGSQGFESRMRAVVLLVLDKSDVHKRFLCLVKGNYLKESQKAEGIELVFNNNLTFEATGNTILFEDIKKDEKESQRRKAFELQKQGCSQLEIAEKLGISQTSVSRLLKG